MTSPFLLRFLCRLNFLLYLQISRSAQRRPCKKMVNIAINYKFECRGVINTDIFYHLAGRGNNMAKATTANGVGNSNPWGIRRHT